MEKKENNLNSRTLNKDIENTRIIMHIELHFNKHGRQNYKPK